MATCEIGHAVSHAVDHASAQEKPSKSRVSRVSLDVPATTYNRFRASCSLHGKHMNVRLAEIMTADADASGIPVACKS